MVEHLLQAVRQPPRVWGDSQRFPKAMALAVHGGRPVHLPVLVDWFGDPLGARVPSNGFMK